jgi:hypothetical protein
MKTVVWVLMGILSNLLISLDSMTILLALMVQIHQHGLSFHYSVPSKISLAFFYIFLLHGSFTSMLEVSFLLNIVVIVTGTAFLIYFSESLLYRNAALSYAHFILCYFAEFVNSNYF